jgi:hypothetical protein
MKFPKTKSIILIKIFMLSLSFYSIAKDIHVAKNGNDANAGTQASPYLTIGKAANVSVAGDVIIIHAGTYREFVNPPRGGTSDAVRITYKSGAGEQVFIKGSEVVNTWVNVGGNVWKKDLPVSFFNGYNPYTLNVSGFFQNYGQWHHRGDVYLNNGVLDERQTIGEVNTTANTWFTSTAGTTTSITANFGSANPNTQLTEINARESIFFTTAINVDYITIDGLRFLHAAPNWQAPNTSITPGPSFISHIGAVGSKMGKAWIVQNCEVQYSKTAGIMFGESPDDLANFSNVTAFGDHIIRNNTVTRCGEYGIVGQRCLSRSHILSNRVEKINYRNEFGGYETAGIKCWGTSDILIENNLVREVTATQNTATSQSYCIWIDYSNQGARITRNYLEAGPMTTTTMFIEADMGPTLIDNNIIVDRPNAPIFIYSAGTILVHNLFINSNFDYAIQQFGNGGAGARFVNTLAPHSLTFTNGNTRCEINNNKMYNNIFAGGAGPINFSKNQGTGNVVDRNLYIDGTTASANHTNVKTSAYNFTHTITDTPTGLNLTFNIDNSFTGIATQYVNPALIGIIPLANQSIETELGAGITVNTDFNALSRTAANPKVGPLENIVSGNNTISIGNAVLPTPITGTVNVAVTGVSVSPTSASVAVGANTTLTPTVAPANATNNTVTWTSSNTAIATVNASGVVTGVAAGTATITVKTNDGNFTATTAITVTAVSSGQNPFGGTARAIPGTVESEDYDTGGQGVAYSDAEVANQGGTVYRATEGVDVGASASEGGFIVGWTVANEWLEYTVNVATAGDYTLGFRYAALNTAGNIHVEFNGVNKTNTVSLPSTGGWDTFQTVNKTVTLAAGVQIMRVFIESAGYNLNRLTFAAIASNQNPFGGTARNIPGVVESEDYDTGGQGIAYSDNEPANQGGTIYRGTEGVDVGASVSEGGNVVGWTVANEWLEYTVNVPTAGNYNMAIRYAALNTAGNIHVEFGGVNKTNTVSLPATGGWDTFQTITRTVALSAGVQIMRVFIESAGYNLNKLTFTTGAARMGVEEEATDHTILVYPNPVSGDEFTILVGKYNDPATVKIMDIMGKPVYEIKTEENSLKLNKKVLPSSGIYIISVLGDDKLKTAKIILE